MCSKCNGVTFTLVDLVACLRIHCTLYTLTQDVASSSDGHFTESVSARSHTVISCRAGIGICRQVSIRSLVSKPPISIYKPLDTTSTAPRTWLAWRRTRQTFTTFTFAGGVPRIPTSLLLYTVHNLPESGLGPPSTSNCEHCHVRSNADLGRGTAGLARVA